MYLAITQPLYSVIFLFQWHLGMFKKDYLPENRGFDSHFGYYMGKSDYFDHYAGDGVSLLKSFHTIWKNNCVKMYASTSHQNKKINVIVLIM